MAESSRAERRRRGNDGGATAAALTKKRGIPSWVWLVVVVGAALGTLLIFKDRTKPAPQHGYEVVAEYPHDAGAYTQGLLVHDGLLYESTGKEGESTIRMSEIESGKLVGFNVISSKLFGEGLSFLNGKFYQLTWKAGKCFVYQRENDKFKRVGEFSYDGEGWGLTHDGKNLILSDGTSVLRFMDPETFKVVRTVTVKNGRKPQAALNELEYIDGEVWANVYRTDLIARIDPESGKVNSYVNLAGLLETAGVRPATAEVLNGIAWDADKKRLLVTGKYWPKMFQIKVVEKD